MVNSKNYSGFTLIEVAVVAAITGIIAAFLLTNFQRSRIDLTLTTDTFTADMRLAQSRAFASAGYDSGSGSKIRCGYGIRYVSASSYASYAGPDASTVDCSSQNRNFDGGDVTINTKSLFDSRLEFKSAFNDIFFEPPDPKTFINNNSSLTLPPQAVTIGKIGGACPQDCKTIYVYTSGKIE